MSGGWYTLSLQVNQETGHASLDNNKVAIGAVAGKIRCVADSVLTKQLRYRFARQKQTGDLARIVLPSKYDAQSIPRETQVCNIRKGWSCQYTGQDGSVAQVELVEMDFGPHLLLQSVHSKKIATWLHFEDEYEEDNEDEFVERFNELVQNFSVVTHGETQCVRFKTHSAVILLSVKGIPEIVEVSMSSVHTAVADNTGWTLLPQNDVTLVVHEATKETRFSLKGFGRGIWVGSESQFIVLGEQCLYLFNPTQGQTSKRESSNQTLEIQALEPIKLPIGCQATEMEVVEHSSRTVTIVLGYCGKQTGLLTLSFPISTPTGASPTRVLRWLPLAKYEGVLVDRHKKDIRIIYFNETQNILYTKAVSKVADSTQELKQVFDMTEEPKEASSTTQSSSFEVLDSQPRICDFDTTTPSSLAILDTYINLSLHKQSVTNIQIFKLSDVIPSGGTQPRPSSHEDSVLFATHVTGAITVWRVRASNLSLWTVIQTEVAVAQKIKRVPAQNSIMLEVLSAVGRDNLRLRCCNISAFLLATLLDQRAPQLQDYSTKIYTVPVPSIPDDKDLGSSVDLQELKGKLLFDYDGVNGLFVLAVGTTYCIYTAQKHRFLLVRQSILDNCVKYVAFKNMRLHLLDEFQSLLIFSLSFEHKTQKKNVRQSSQQEQKHEPTLTVNPLYTENIPRTLQAFSIDMEGYALGLSVEGQFFVSVTTANYPFTYVDNLYRVCTSNTIFLKSNLHNVAVADWNTEGGVISSDILWLDDEGGLSQALGSFQGVMEDGEIASKIIAVQSFDGVVKFLGFRESHTEKNCLFGAFSHYLMTLKQAFITEKQPDSSEPGSKGRNCINMDIVSEFIGMTDNRTKEEVFKDFKSKFIPHQIEPFFTMSSAEQFFKELGQLMASTHTV